MCTKCGFVFTDGQFGAMMQVHIQNDGPVTITFESPKVTHTELPSNLFSFMGTLKLRALIDTCIILIILLYFQDEEGNKQGKGKERVPRQPKEKPQKKAKQDNAASAASADTADALSEDLQSKAHISESSQTS